MQIADPSGPHTVDEIADCTDGQCLPRWISRCVHSPTTTWAVDSCRYLWLFVFLGRSARTNERARTAELCTAIRTAASRPERTERRLHHWKHAGGERRFPRPERVLRVGAGLSAQKGPKFPGRERAFICDAFTHPAILRVLRIPILETLAERMTYGCLKTSVPWCGSSVSHGTKPRTVFSFFSAWRLY